MDSNDHFVHQKLPTASKSFRLLRLEAALTRTARLRGSLFEHALDDAPPYQALSYCWGSRDPPEHITLGRKRLRITTNCAAALRRLRYRFKARMLWIDAICIDQASDDEKAMQIPIMGDIYSQASQVVVWLGEASLSAYMAFKRLRIYHALDQEFMHRVTRKLDWGLKKVEWEGYEPLAGNESAYLLSKLSTGLAFSATMLKIFGRHRRMPENLIEYEKIEHEPSSWDELLNRPWFSRTWTIQEVALAKRGQLQCGPNLADWGNFLQLASNLDIPRDYQDILFKSSSPQFLRFGMHYPVRQRLAEGSSCKTVSDILLLTQYQEAIDPRDKIYGLYAILIKLGVELPAPDLQKDAATIYRETTTAIMLHDNSLRILGAAYSLSNLPGQPSWVPNFSAERRPFPIDMGCDNYRASGNSQPTFHFSDSGSALFLSGLAADEIASCCQGMESNSLNDEARNEEEAACAAELDSWISLAKSLKVYPIRETYDPQRSVQYALIQTLCRNLRGPLPWSVEWRFKHCLERAEEHRIRAEQRKTNEPDHFYFRKEDGGRDPEVCLRMMKYTRRSMSGAMLGPELARTMTRSEYLEIFRSNPWLYYLQKLATEFIGFNMSYMLRLVNDKI